MSTLENVAAYVPAAGAKISVSSAPFPELKENHLIIHNQALALNPIDFKLQEIPLFPWTKYPTVLGGDVAGTIYAIGQNSPPGLSVGDRVLSPTFGQATTSDENAGFQRYILTRSDLVCKIPDSLSFEEATVLPVGVSTASCGLFQPDLLALELPALPRVARHRSVLIWGASTSVGCNAVQLANAAGYNVYATASPRNFELIMSLGATQVFDYSGKDVVNKITAALEEATNAGVEFAGAFHIVGSMPDVFSVVDAATKTKGRKYVSSVQEPSEGTKIPEGLETSKVFAMKMQFYPFGTKILQDFLPKALTEGVYKAAPEPMVVGKGLEAIQGGLEILSKGVSAKKVVVSLQ